MPKCDECATYHSIIASNDSTNNNVHYIEFPGQGSKQQMRNIANIFKVDTMPLFPVNTSWHCFHLAEEDNSLNVNCLRVFRER